MDTQWLETASDRLAHTWQQVANHLQALTDPVRLRMIKQGLCAIAALWMVFGLSSLVWSLVPAPVAGEPPSAIVNPLVEPSRGGKRASVDIENLVTLNLFGTAATTPSEIPAAQFELTEGRNGGLDGIEDGAQETRLDLKLQGTLASSDVALARAIIEAKKEQAQYAVGDELPVGGKVTVAKILSDRVVLDNGGKYELLILYDENSMGASRTASAPLAPPEEEDSDAGKARTDQRGNRNITQMAESYRKRLYSNPQSLSQVVRIAAVREDGRLQGYRVSAGRDRQQFEALGFKADDIVTGVNGIELTDPGKAMELYRVMRNANEASFNVLRDGEQLTLVVGLNGASE